MKKHESARMLNPVHPGDFIKHEIVALLSLSVTAAAKVLGVSRPTLSSLLNQRASLSGDMAVRIEKAFGVSMETLMRMQSEYDIVQARKRQHRIKVSRYRGVRSRLAPQSKRKLFDELISGVAAFKRHREGELILRATKIEPLQPRKAHTND
jgi:addiction module HigA family antidote